MTAVNSVTPTIQADVSLLYIAFFGRAPDAAGFSYWTREFAANPSTQTEAGAAAYAQNVAAVQMAGNKEFTDIYGGLTPTQAVNTFYRNVLNREADADGLAYWVSEIEDDVPFGTVAWNIVYAASQGGPDVLPADAALVNNKVDVAEFFTIDLASNDLNAARSAFSTVTSDPATVGPAQDALLIATANQITLTPIVETLVGASGNNTFNAMGFVSSTGDVIQTLGNGDTLIGSVNGVNTLNANLVSSGVTPNALTNIQQIVLTNGTNANANTFGLTNANAVEAITLNALGGNLAISDAQSASITYSINNTTGGKVVGIALDDDVDTNIDAADLVVRNSNIKLDLDADYEVLGLEMISTSTVGTDFAGEIIAYGQGNLTLNGSAGATIASTEINATQLSGTFTTALGNSDTIILGGSGNTTLTNGNGSNLIVMGNGTDSLTTTVSQLTNDTVVGGLGVDTIILSTATVDIGGTMLETALTNVSGFEALTLSSTGTNDIVISQEFVGAGFATINGGTNFDTVTAQSVALDGLTFNGGTGTGDSFVFSTASGTVNINNVEAVSAVGGTNLAQTVNLQSTTGTLTVSLGSGADTLNILANNTITVTTTGVETINAVFASVTGNTVILGDDATAVTVTGGLGKLTLNANNIVTAANTYAFGGAADTLIVSSLNNLTSAVSIDGGAGTDTLELSVASLANSDNAFSKMNNFEILKLSSAGTNSVTVGTNFVNVADFTTISGSTTNDTVIATTSLTNQTFNGGLGDDTLIFNTAGGTVTINEVEAVTAVDGGNNNQIINIASLTGDVSVALGSGTGDTVNILANNTITVTTTGVETINAVFASVTGNTVILGDDATAVTVTGGLGKLTLNANNIVTAANTYAFGGAADTLIVSSLNNLTSAVSIDGGAGTDTLALSVGSNSNTDNAFIKMNNFETLTLIDGATNNVTIGTNFLNADFTSIVGGTNFDTVTAQSVTLNGLLFNGGTGTGDTLALVTAGGTVTINNVESVTSTGIADTTVTIAGTEAVVSGIDLGQGTDSVIVTNTNSVTVTLTGVETYFGSVSNATDTIILGSGGAITINGGGGTDSVTLAVNTSNVTVLAASGLMSVTGSALAGSVAETLTIAGPGTYNLTSVETVNVTGGTNAAIDAWLFSIGGTGASGAGTAGVTTLFNYDLGTGNSVSADFIMTQNAVTGGSTYLTVDAGDVVSAQITLVNNLEAAAGTGSTLVITNDSGYTTIGFGTGADIVQTNLAGLSVGTSTSDSFVVSSFSTSDDIDLSNYTLVDKAGRQTVLDASFFTTAGLQDADTFVLDTTFITGNSTTLADLTDAPNQRGIIFQFNIGSTTADFTTQAGINAAVTWIDANIGTTTSGSQSAVLAVNSGTGANQNALFLFQDNGGVGIDASELKLIGVVSGSTLSANSFI